MEVLSEMRWETGVEMSDELKPCPFCGHEAVIYQIPEDSKINRLYWNVWIVGCDGEIVCPGHVWKTAPIYVTKESAIEHWNKRAE